VTASILPPLFSIVVPTYNRAHFIARTLESLVAQIDRSFEIIVVDDGSKDDTSSVVSRFADAGVIYHRKDNGERGAARNFGARLARGRYLNFFDSDDLAYAHHLAEAREMITTHGEPEFFHLRFDVRDETGKVLRVAPPQADTRTATITPRGLLRGNGISCNGVFIRSDVAIAHPFDEERELAGSEDWVLWLRLVSRFRFFESMGGPTTSVVEHKGRSVATVGTLSAMEARAASAVRALGRDTGFMRTFGRKGLARVRASMQTYAALYAALGNAPPGATLGLLGSALRECPREVFGRRTVAIFKHLLLNRMRASSWRRNQADT
jgi:hypothetical protein